MDETCHHASCAVLDGRAVLLRGAPGAGKSDLLLRLIVEAGAGLVADDRVCLRRAGETLLASSPAALRGVLEVRGVGLVRLACAGDAPVALVADLSARPQRLPEPAYATLLGLRRPRVELAAGQPSAVAKLQLALGAGGATILPADWHPADAPDGGDADRSGGPSAGG
jgi:hypothetical protein